MVIGQTVLITQMLMETKYVRVAAGHTMDWNIMGVAPLADVH